MLPRVLYWAYQLRAHRCGGWALDRWLATLPLLAAVIVLARWYLGERSALAAWQWATLALLIIAGGAVLWLRRWAAGHAYLVFEPQPDLPPPDGQALDPGAKILLHATGRFEVEGKSGFFAHLLAYWRTFATREHAVMAIVHNTRLLLLGHRPEEEIGMWYIFFRPEEIEAVTAGRLSFGSTVRPALRLRYLSTPTTPRKRRKPTQPISELVYLVFDDEATRAIVWADVRADHRFSAT